MLERETHRQRAMPRRCNLRRGRKGKPQMKIRSYIRHHARPLAAYNGPQLRSYYGFPSAIGAQVKVGIIELGGGFVQSDLDSYFKGLALPVLPNSVLCVNVQGAANAPGDPELDAEVYLDLCVIGSMAPGCRMLCYFAPNTEAGFANAIGQAALDGCKAISISWGAAEMDWSSSGLSAMQAALSKASSLGIIVCAASGDSGSSDGEAGSNVDFPASSPYVLGCGGTSLPTLNASNESAWSEGGGGSSSKFSRPGWQTGTDMVMRAVPDVAGSADPEYGWSIVIDGQPGQIVGGTSAVAPMWAALVACLASEGHAIASLEALLYANPSACRDITQGSNGSYRAGVGYDCCTGLGVPSAAIETVFKAPAPPAPTPPAPTPPAPAPPAPVQTHTVIISGAIKSIVIDGKAVALTQRSIPMPIKGKRRPPVPLPPPPVRRGPPQVVIPRSKRTNR